VTDLVDIDQQLGELGPLPDDVEELISAYGETDHSPEHLDQVLEALAEGVQPVASEGLGVVSELPPAPAPDSRPHSDTDSASASVPASASASASDSASDTDTDTEAVTASAPAPAAPGLAKDTVVDQPAEQGLETLDEETDGLFDTLEDEEPVDVAAAADEAEDDDFELLVDEDDIIEIEDDDFEMLEIEDDD
jgi:hypothetical protein